MTSILHEGATRRWCLRVAIVTGLTALLIGLASSITAQENSQENPRPPHWFWGTDLDSYVGDQVVAINQDGQQVGASTVDSQGGWTVTVSPETARTVTLQLISDSGTRATDAIDVMEGGFDADGLSITEFRNRIDDTSQVDETIKVEIYARLHPTRTPRTWEFTVRVDGVPVDPAPRARYHGPSLQREAWYSSSPISIAGGFEVQVIACRTDDEDMRFGLRVEGQDDIIPRRNLLPGDRTSTNWARSNLIDLPLPGSDPDPSRAPGTRAPAPDADCRYGK